MRDFLRDWRRWSLAERTVAIALVAGIALMQIPLIF